MGKAYCFVVNEKEEVIAQGVFVDYVSDIRMKPPTHVLIATDNGDIIKPLESVFYKQYME